MQNPKLITAEVGTRMHLAVATIPRNGYNLLLAKKSHSYGGFSDHIYDETPDDALKRMLNKYGLQPTSKKVIGEFRIDTKCSSGVCDHNFHLYDCNVIGTPRLDDPEIESIGWYAKGQVRQLNLDTLWNQLARRSRLI
jgi:hypothetical protein